MRALCIALAILACGATRATAQEVGVDSEDEPDSEPSARAITLKSLWSDLPALRLRTGGPIVPDQTLYFIGLDSWQNGTGGYTGLQWEPAQLSNNKFILRLLSSDSLDRYFGDRHRYTTQTARAAVLPGIKFERGSVEIQLLGGIELEADLRAKDGRPDRLRYRTGWRGAAEVWWELSRSLMVSTSFSATSILDGVNLRAATGWRVGDWFWAGPEVALSHDTYSDQYRFGIHLTGFRGRTEYFEWSVAAGYTEDSFQRNGLYGRVGMLIRTQNGMHLD